MSYTMTLDMPPKTAAYVEHSGSRFQSQLKSLVIAFVTAEMQREGAERNVKVIEKSSLTKTGALFARAWGRMGVEEGELDLSRRSEHLREIEFA